MTSPVYFGSPRQARLEAKENIPTSIEVHTREGHPFQWLHGPLKNPYQVAECGEQLGLGSRQYELVDVLPVEQITLAPIGYISAR